MSKLGSPVPGVGKLEATQRAVMVQGSTWSLGEETEEVRVEKKAQKL